MIPVEQVQKGDKLKVVCVSVLCLSVSMFVGMSVCLCLRVM